MRQSGTDHLEFKASRITDACLSVKSPIFLPEAKVKKNSFQTEVYALDRVMTLFIFAMSGADELEVRKLCEVALILAVATVQCGLGQGRNGEVNYWKT